MAGVTSIEVKESLDDLAERLRQSEQATIKERLQVQYLAQARDGTQHQCHCQSERQTSGNSTTVVIPLPG